MHYGKLKETMLQVFEEESLNFSINGHPKETLPHILNVHFPGVSIESLLVNLDMGRNCCFKRIGMYGWICPSFARVKRHVWRRSKRADILSQNKLRSWE